MTTSERGRKAGASFQIDVQIDQFATLPHGRLTAGLSPDLDWDEGEGITQIDLRRRDVEHGADAELIGPEGWLT